MSRQTFDKIIDLIKDDKIFHSTGPKSQRPAFYQLGCFLARYGSLGTQSIDVAQKLSIAEGTVPLYCARVSKAI